MTTQCANDELWRLLALREPPLGIQVDPRPARTIPPKFTSPKVAVGAFVASPERGIFDLGPDYFH